MAEPTPTPPAPNPTPTPAPTPAPTTWVESLSPEMKNFVTEQGFKEPSDVVAGYQGMLKLRGVAADKLIRSPDSYTDAKEQEAALNAIYDRLGRPKAPTEYGIENKDFAEDTKFMAEIFHKQGLSKQQAAEISKAFIEKTQASTKAQQENQQNQAKLALDKLKTEWGSTFENNLNVAKSGQKALGWDDKKVDQVANSVGLNETLKMLNDVGRRVGESQFISGNKGDMIHTPDTAQAKIKQLMTDKTFTEKLMSGDAIAKQQWNQLHEQLGAGQNYG
jgi:hypothetical protein